MAINFVQGASSTGHAINSISASFPSANTANNTLVVCVGCWKSGSVGTPTISDSQGNAYTLIQSDSSVAAGNSKVAVWAAQNINAGANTVTIAGLNTVDADVIVAEYTPASVDASSVAVSAATSTAAPSVTPSQTNDLLLVYTYDQSNVDTFTFSSSPTESFTQRAITSNGAGAESSALADAALSSAAAVTPTAATSAGSSNAVFAVAVLLSVPVAIGGGSQIQLTFPGAWEVTATSQNVPSGFGAAPVTLAPTGTFPTGTSFDAGTGEITGTPTTAGTFSFGIVATDAHGKKATFGFTVLIDSGGLSDTSVCAAILYGGVW
jgi:hypothetical protein